MLPIVARKTWRTLEPFHSLVNFAAEPEDCYAALGLSRSAGYLASRSAAMGTVPAEVVVATFYGFDPALVHQALAGVWSVVSPEQVVAARLAGIDVALHRLFGTALAGPEVQEAAALARVAAEAAPAAGRPLFAGHASLAWPDEPHLVLWHAVTLLREHRGDGHVACLLAAGVGPLESLVLHASQGEVGRRFLQANRGWSDEAWQAATAGLAERGLVAPDGGSTDAGRALRDGIEERTDELALPAWLPLGEDGCTRLRALVRPFSRAIVETGILGFTA